MTARLSAFATGICPGLPPRATYVPFGKDDPYAEATGLTEKQLCCVLALMSAEILGVESGMLSKDVAWVTGYFRDFGDLIQSRWVEKAARIPGKCGHYYRATDRAWRELFPAGWEAPGEVLAELGTETERRP